MPNTREIDPRIRRKSDKIQDQVDPKCSQDEAKVKDTQRKSHRVRQCIDILMVSPKKPRRPARQIVSCRGFAKMSALLEAHLGHMSDI